MNLDLDLGVPDRSGWETASVLVTVKAYPVIGRRTGESVCVAGVRLDRGAPEWIRLFPVPFRALAPDRQFRKYTVVQLRVRRREGSDRRPESYAPDLDSMRLGQHLAAQRTWSARWDVLGDLAGATSACELLHGARAAGQSAPSLGLVRPSVRDVVVTANPAFRRAAPLAPDVDLFGTETEALEAQPYVVRLRYRCSAPGCVRDHDQTVVDWEAGQLGRRLLGEGRSAAEARDLVEQKYRGMFAPGRDPYLYLGNQHQHPISYLVLGVFWPPSGSRPQATLF